MNKSFPLLICDFETGGLNCRVNAITEFAGIIIDTTTFQEIARYDAILQPYDKSLLYEPDALAHTNINMSQLEAGVDLKTFKKDFLAFLKKGKIYKGEKFQMVMAGHNILFDAGFMQHLFHYLNADILTYLAGDIDFFGNPQLHLLDTMKLAIQTWAEDETMLGHTLTDCVNKIGDELVNAHRAMNDVQATVGLVVDLLKRLRRQGVSIEQAMTGNNQQLRFREQFKFQ